MPERPQPASPLTPAVLPHDPEPRSTSGFGNTGFGNTGFGVPQAPGATASESASVFDVCHVGVVLRTLVFVHGVVGIGVLFSTRGLAGWIQGFAAASTAALPAVLLWLLLACAGKRPLGSLPLPGQWGVAIALGALSGLAGSSLAWFGGADGPGPAPWLASALAGAALAAAVFQWLRLRAQALLPADTTARLAELQSRIQPHFLFNTLNTALVLVRHDPARAEAVLEDLAELFRVAISDNPESVSLADEVELARRYLAIEQIRFGNRLQVKWELDPAAGAARVPPLLLQPLVENAVRHGVEPADEGGVIRVRTGVRRGRALVAIVNSVSAEPSRPGNGMALRNVRERLRLMHDVAAQFDIRTGAGTFSVQIAVPL